MPSSDGEIWRVNDTVMIDVRTGNEEISEVLSHQLEVFGGGDRGFCSCGFVSSMYPAQ